MSNCGHVLGPTYIAFMVKDIKVKVRTPQKDLIWLEKTFQTSIIHVELLCIAKVRVAIKLFHMAPKSM